MRYRFGIGVGAPMFFVAMLCAAADGPLLLDGLAPFPQRCDVLDLRMGEDTGHLRIRVNAKLEAVQQWYDRQFRSWTNTVPWAPLDGPLHRQWSRNGKCCAVIIARERRSPPDLWTVLHVNVVVPHGIRPWKHARLSRATIRNNVKTMETIDRGDLATIQGWYDRQLDGWAPAPNATWSDMPTVDDIHGLCHWKGWRRGKEACSIRILPRGQKPTRFAVTLRFGDRALLDGLAPAPVTDPKIECLERLHRIARAKEHWAMRFGKTKGDIVTAEDIAEYMKDGTNAFSCPGTGRYDLGGVGEKPRCSVHGAP